MRLYNRKNLIRFLTVCPLSRFPRSFRPRLAHPNVKISSFLRWDYSYMYVVGGLFISNTGSLYHTLRS